MLSNTKKTKTKKRTIVPVATRKRRVMKAAVDEFLKHGYTGASVEKIAHRAGISKPTIYRWHANKERLFIAATLSLLDYSTSLMKGLEEDARSPDIVLREAARKWLASYLRPEMRGLVRLTIAEAQRFPAIAAEVRASTSRKLYRPIAAYLTKLAKQGVIESKNIELTANLFGILAVQGHRFMFDEPKYTEADYDHIDTVIDLFLNGCLSRQRVN